MPVDPPNGYPQPGYGGNYGGGGYSNGYPRNYFSASTAAESDVRLREVDTTPVPLFNLKGLNSQLKDK